MRKRMNIAFVAQPFDSFLPPVQTSLGLWIYETAQRLAESCNVIIYARKKRFQNRLKLDRKVKYRFISCVHYQILLKLLKPFSKLFDVKRPYFSSSFFCLDYVLKVAKDLKKQDFDIVHILNFSQFVPIIRRFNPEIKIVLHMQCEWLTQLDQKMIGQQLKEVNLIIGCSEYITKKIRNYFPQFADRCKTVYNGVNVDHFVRGDHQNKMKKNETKRLLLVGRVSPEKGVHVLLNAFKKVVSCYPKVELKIIGHKTPAPYEFIVGLSDDPKILGLAPFYSGSYLSHLKNRLPSSSTNKISFAGPIPHTELINHYRDADIFVYPSVWHEPFGIPPIEAMAAGIPVIATRSGGITETVKDGETGLLVGRDDVKALAEAILSLLSNDELMCKMGKTGRQRAVELFSWEHITKSLIYRYESILN